MTAPVKCLELFSGAGGLAMGLHNAHFQHAGLVEYNRDACNTMRHNKTHGKRLMRGWNIVEADTRSIPNFVDQFGPIDLVAGGPPCQPFSIGGKGRGPGDERDMFPEAVRAVRQCAPLGFVIENVKGLLRESFATYFNYIVLQLSYPTIVRKANECAMDHCARLEKIHTQGRGPSLQYRVVWQLVNAANYGVPQRRERVFLVGFRSDLHAPWSFPEPTHSKAELDRSKATGEYYDRHKVARGRGAAPHPVVAGTSGLQPWLTVRDALIGLPDPERDQRPEINHVFVDGARSYPGHTGSPLDMPAKTLKAGDHGVPGGENMVLMPDGRVRYFTLREAARLQTFSDDYLFCSSWTESMRQLGNAVPPTLAEIVAASVRAALLPHYKAERAN